MGKVQRTSHRSNPSFSDHRFSAAIATHKTRIHLHVQKKVVAKNPEAEEPDADHTTTVSHPPVSLKHTATAFF